MFVLKLGQKEDRIFASGPVAVQSAAGTKSACTGIAFSRSSAVSRSLWSLAAGWSFWRRSPVDRRVRSSPTFSGRPLQHNKERLVLVGPAVRHQCARHGVGAVIPREMRNLRRDEGDFAG